VFLPIHLRESLKIVKFKALEILKPEFTAVNEDLKFRCNTEICIFRGYLKRYGYGQA
jgi:hypothetical protein